MLAALTAFNWKQALTGGVGLVTLTVAASSLLRIASTIALTRLLAPADFGIVGITAMLLAIATMISDFGFGVFIIQHPDGRNQRFLNVVWTVRLIRSIALTLLGFVLAAPLAALIGKPELEAVIAVSSLHFLIEGCSSLSLMTVVRDQKLMRLSLVDVSTTAAQIAISIALAGLTHSYWSIVVAGLLGTALKTVLSYTFFENARPALAFETRYVRELWKFGRTIMGAHTIHVLMANADKIVLSRVFPLHTLGLYNLATNLASAPLGFTSAYPGRVLLPAYAEAQRTNPVELRRVYYEGRWRVMLAYMAAIGLFIGMAPVAVDLLYDDRYADASTYLRILALAPLLGLNNCAAREVLIVIGRVNAFFYGNLVRLAWLGLAGMTGFLVYGPLGLIVAVGCIEVPVLLYNWFELARARLLQMDRELIMLGVGAAAFVLGYAAAELYFGLKR